MGIIDMTVSELISALEKHELTSREITEEYLSRAEKTEPDINAYITLCREKAAAASMDADDRNLKPIYKIPFAVKDNIAVSGVKMTCASRMLENFVPTYTAAAVERLGDIVLGKTNMDEFAMGSSCEKTIFGAVHNPLSHSHSAGGSSGGSAACVAAKSAPWAIGTDTGGSARQPASFCGVVSMKPTYGLVSRYGVTEFASSLDTVCPITKNVYDNALMLEMMAGNDSRDMTSCKRDSFVGEFTSELNDSSEIRGLRVGLMDGFEKLCSDTVIKSTMRIAGIFEKLGAAVERTVMPDPEATLGAYLVISQAECSSNFSRYDGLKYGLSVPGGDYREIMRNSRALGFGDEVKRRILSGSYALSESHGGNFYPEIKRIRTDICHAADKLWEKFDVIIMPTAADVAFELGSYSSDPTKLYGSDIFTVFANLTGVPAISIPSGGDGVLPCGISLIGKKYSERLLYKTAYVIENELIEYMGSEVGAA